MISVYPDHPVAFSSDSDFTYALRYPSSDGCSSGPSSPLEVAAIARVRAMPPHLKLSTLAPPPSAALVSPTYSPTDSGYASTLTSPVSSFISDPPALPPHQGVPTPRPTSLLPDPAFSFPGDSNFTGAGPSSFTGPTRGSSSRPPIPHPYARLYTKREGKRRKMWNHALEKAVFTPQEIATMGAPNRRTIYTATLEAHVDRLHAQLLGYELFPVDFHKLDPFRGLNSKTAKSMVAGLERDAHELRLKRLELQRANDGLRRMLPGTATAPAIQPTPSLMLRRHSLNGAC